MMRMQYIFIDINGIEKDRVSWIKKLSTFLYLSPFGLLDTRVGGQ